MWHTRADAVTTQWREPDPSGDRALRAGRPIPSISSAPTTDGFGLGLSIVQELCNQAGCGFDFQSPRPGDTRGVAVTVTFPPREDAT